MGHPLFEVKRAPYFGDLRTLLKRVSYQVPIGLLRFLGAAYLSFSRAIRGGGHDRNRTDDSTFRLAAAGAGKRNFTGDRRGATD